MLHRVNEVEEVLEFFYYAMENAVMSHYLPWLSATGQPLRTCLSVRVVKLKIPFNIHYSLSPPSQVIQSW